MKTLKRIVLTLLISLMLAGTFCASAMAATKLSATKIVLVKGQTKTLKVKGTKGKVTWSSSKKSIATVNSKGLVRAKKAGKAVITAKVGKQKLTCNVKVENTEISNAEIQLKIGETRLLSMKNCTQKVKWKASNKVVAIKKINAQEVYVTARKQGAATVTATVGGKKFTCRVIVTKLDAGNNNNDREPDRDTDDGPVDDTGEVTVESIRLDKDSVNLTVGNTCTLTATVFPRNATDKTVTWSSNDKSVASVTDGTVIAVSPGTALITARAGNCQASCAVRVSEVKVSSVKLNITSKDIKIGDSFVLEATVSPSNAADKTITWNSDEPQIASVDDNGRVVGISDGIARITARAGDCEARCTVRVSEVKVSSVKLNITSKNIKVGDSFVLEATVSPSDVADKTVTWNSDEPQVASVDDNGRVVGVSDGLARITARAGDCAASCTVWVKEVDVSSVKLNVTSKSIIVGDSFMLEATVFPDNATNKTVTWSSSAPEVAAVDSNGRVTGVSSGTARITATSGYRDATCQVRVDEPDYSCNEEWKVEGEWGFKVNSVSTHYLCNSVSDKTGAQVVIIDYTYYQYGYHGSIMDLYFGSLDMDVTDGRGAAASTYPCTHEKNPKELHNIGEYCNASQAFILENKSETISLTVSKYPSNSGQEKRARFVLPVKASDAGDGKQRLKSYILSHGATNADGNRFIKSLYQNGTYGITYNSLTEEFQFIQAVDNGQSEGALEMVVPEKSMGLLTVNLVWTYTSSVGSAGFEAKATIDPRIYTTDMDVIFTIESSTLADEQMTNERRAANSQLKLAFAGWSELLLKGKVGITMNDIGFAAYK